MIVSIVHVSSSIWIFIFYCQDLVPKRPSPGSVPTQSQKFSKTRKVQGGGNKKISLQKDEDLKPCLGPDLINPQQAVLLDLLFVQFCLLKSLERRYQKFRCQHNKCDGYESVMGARPSWGLRDQSLSQSALTR